MNIVQRSMFSMKLLRIWAWLSIGCLLVSASVTHGAFEGFAQRPFLLQSEETGRLYGPFEFKSGIRLMLGNSRFVLVVQPDSQMFQVASEKTDEVYGPFDFTSGTAITLGDVSFRIIDPTMLLTSTLLPAPPETVPPVVPADVSAAVGPPVVTVTAVTLPEAPAAPRARPPAVRTTLTTETLAVSDGLFRGFARRPFLLRSEETGRLFGPFEYESGAQMALANGRFVLAVQSDRRLFEVAVETTDERYGPFEFINGTLIELREVPYRIIDASTLLTSPLPPSMRVPPAPLPPAAPPTPVAAKATTARTAMLTERTSTTWQDLTAVCRSSRWSAPLSRGGPLSFLNPTCWHAAPAQTAKTFVGTAVVTTAVILLLQDDGGRDRDEVTAPSAPRPGGGGLPGTATGGSGGTVTPPVDPGDGPFIEEEA